MAFLALALLGGCDDPQTALVLEVESALPEGALDAVSFHVLGPGLGPGGRTTEVPLTGPSAKRFPLTLALVHGGGEMGPLHSKIEGRSNGATVAKTSIASPIYFIPRRTVTHRFVLERLPAAGDAGQAHDAGVPTPAVDASVSVASTDAGVAAPMPTMPVPVRTEVVRAKEIQADTVKANVIYAKEVVAEEGSIAKVIESPDEKRWEDERTDGRIETTDLVADQIFVKELRCRRLEAAEVRAQRVRVGR